MKTASRVCENCGEKIFGDAPKGLCPACVLETGLGPLTDEPVAGIGDPGPPAGVLMDFGDYELLEEIGRGGQGVVYRARQKSLNRTVALKVIGLGQWATQAHLKRFRREAEAAANLDHPCIVPIYEVGECEGSCYFSMNFIDGGQLDEVAKRQPISFRNAAELIAKLARTVHYAHEHGILHRDIKPGNILLDAKGEPHLTDFGLARLLETKSTVTHTMDVLGTPSYMAPEQASGQKEQLTRATDVYGLGAVFYQLLTGHAPFAGGTTYETVRLVLETDPRQPRLWNPKLDRDLATICLKCLEKDPHRRYAAALALAEDVEHWLKHEPIRAHPTGIFTRGKKWLQRNPTTALVFALSLAFATTLGVMFWKSESVRRPPSGIAVLPFENLSADKENAFFADGVHEDILTKLAKIADLKVIDRTSVMPYRGARNTRQIGNALRVSHVLEGSVQRAGSKVRVNAQLIDTRTDRHVWAEQYDRPIGDVFAIQSEIAEKIAGELRTRISLAERSAIGKKPTQNVEAYELYLRAKLLMHTSPVESDAAEKASAAIALLEKAVAYDPDFALAYCLLADAQLLRHWRVGPAPDALQKAEKALQAAQHLAPNAGETHLVEALYFYYGYRDYNHALESLEKAEPSLPNSAYLFLLRAMVERRMGRWNEALRHFARARELNPKGFFLLRDGLIATLLFTREYAEARRVADRAIAELPEKTNELRRSKATAAIWMGDLEQAQDDLAGLPADSDTSVIRWTVAFYKRDYAEAYRTLSTAKVTMTTLALYGQTVAIPYLVGLTARAEGDVEKAKSAFLDARKAYIATLGDKADGINDLSAPLPAEIQVTFPHYFPEVLSNLAIVDAALGRKEQALREARRAVELRPISHDAFEGTIDVQNLALVYCWIGERDNAIEQISLLVKEAGKPSYGELKLDPVWDPIRGGPRFDRILEEAKKPVALK
jgi:serine/threonine protein kinase/tetratricopeptide (TPR) repeat protein